MESEIIEKSSGVICKSLTSLCNIVGPHIIPICVHCSSSSPHMSSVNTKILCENACLETSLPFHPYQQVIQ